MLSRQYLVQNKYAAPGKVAIHGGSNGGRCFLCGESSAAHAVAGLLVSACVLRAPEGTFGAAVAEVGVHDYLKV
jgi:prolyl oligopeptidase